MHLEYEDENNENQPYIRSTEKPLKSRKEKKVGIDLKPPTGELVSPTPAYLKEANPDKMMIDADSTFGKYVTNRLQSMEDGRAKEYAKFKS